MQTDTYEAWAAFIDRRIRADRKAREKKLVGRNW